MDQRTLSLLEIAVPVGVVVFLVRFYLSLRRNLAPARLLLAGEYAEALPLCEAASQGRNTTLADAASYNVAVCLHHLGRLDEAEAALRGLLARHPEATIAGLGQGLLGATRALGETFGPETERQLERGREAFAHPSSWLWLAHAALARGDRTEANTLIARALSETKRPGGQLGMMSTRVDEIGLRALEAYLVGWYREKTEDRGAALAAYLEAASVPRRSVYVERARAAVERLRRNGAKMNDARVGADGEPPGSIGPFVAD